MPDDANIELTWKMSGVPIKRYVPVVEPAIWRARAGRQQRIMTYIGISAVWLKEHDAAIARKAREDVLGLARDMYSLMMCVEKTNTDEFMEYYADRMNGLKEQYESLRSTTPQSEQEEQPR